MRSEASDVNSGEDDYYDGNDRDQMMTVAIGIKPASFPSLLSFPCHTFRLGLDT